jgi:high-affinity Fe2+/Pb2+ permease
MNIFGKVGFGLIIAGGLIFAGIITWIIIETLIRSTLWYIQLPITAIILGLILMLLSAIYDRYKSVKTEEVKEKC